MLMEVSLQKTILILTIHSHSSILVIKHTNSSIHGRIKSMLFCLRNSHVFFSSICILNNCNTCQVYVAELLLPRKRPTQIRCLSLLWTNKRIRVAELFCLWVRIDRHYDQKNNKYYLLIRD